jgi:ubiquinol-cytochrome c reductase iron-sulfur subunit
MRFPGDNLPPMSNAAQDPTRRNLLIATAGLTGVGIVATAIPFISSMQPSEAAKAAGAPVEVDISNLAPGRLITVEWRGKPVWILHRTDAMLAGLTRHDGLLADPQSVQPQQPSHTANAERALKPAFFVAVGICTHLGCIPIFRPEPGAADISPDWPGGFYCPCHGSKFDLSGRVFKNVPAPLNLEIPEYRYLSDTRLLVGAGTAA